MPLEIVGLHIIVDMNLSPSWVDFLLSKGISAVHWRDIGDLRASDAVIMERARIDASVVLTHDLDFGILLALNCAVGPSVVQLRSQDLTPAAVGEIVVMALIQFQSQIQSGAILTVDATTSRIKVLPIHK